MFGLKNTSTFHALFSEASFLSHQSVFICSFARDREKLDIYRVFAIFITANYRCRTLSLPQFMWRENLQNFFQFRLLLEIGIIIFRPNLKLGRKYINSSKRTLPFTLQDESGRVWIWKFLSPNYCKFAVECYWNSRSCYIRTKYESFREKVGFFFKKNKIFFLRTPKKGLPDV